MTAVRIRSFRGPLTALLLTTFLTPNLSQAFLQNRWHHRDLARKWANALKNDCIKKAAPTTSAADINGFINDCNGKEGYMRKDMNIANRNGSDRIQPAEMQTMNKILTMWGTKRSKLQQRVASGNLQGTPARRPASGQYYGNSFGGYQQPQAGGQYRN